jgi:hypothetical protein
MPSCQPSFTLRSTTRAGATVQQVDHPPATPCERLVEPPAVADAVQDQQRAERDRRDPLGRFQRSGDRAQDLAHQPE